MLAIFDNNASSLKGFVNTSCPFISDVGSNLVITNFTTFSRR
jgi:hypothetical protein